MKNLTIESLIEKNIIKIEGMQEEKTMEVVGVNDLPTKVRVNNIFFNQ